jgi:hypothetical protein
MITLDDITAKVDPAILATHDTQAITDAFNVGRTKVQARLGGIGLVLEALGPVDGAALLDGLQALSPTIPALKWAFTLISRGELDFGSVATRGMIDMLVAQGAIAAPLGAALKATAEVPDPVSTYDITVCVQDNQGVWRI